MLPDDKRRQLDNIVSKMVANKESDSNIQFVVDDFKKKYSTQATNQPTGPDLLSKTANVVNSIFPGKQVGEAIGTAGGALYTKAKDLITGTNNFSQYDLSSPKPTQVLGDIASGASTIAGLKLPVPTGTLTNVAQYGVLGATGSGGESLAKGNEPSQVASDAAKGGIIGGVVGGVFNLLGKGINKLAEKIGPSTLSFTSGVPKKAIEQVANNPEKFSTGVKLSVPEVRQKAVQSLTELNQDLSKEFSNSLDLIKSTSGQTSKGVAYNQQGFVGSSRNIANNLTEYGRNFAREFRIGTKSSPNGVVLNFDKSPIVKAGEKTNVQEAFNTISKWDDFSARGMQDLAERIGALRNFESGAKTESSAIISKIYNKIAGTGNTPNGLIPTFYPELAKARTNFAVNKSILDEINNVISADAKKPTAIQGAVSRLDNLFKENKDAYINVIKNLSDKSGVDYLSLLASGEFQKILPNYIRGLGGAATVGIASYLNPFAILLAPLFSPRGVGLIAKNAKTISSGASKATRAISNEVIKKVTPK